MLLRCHKFILISISTTDMNIILDILMHFVITFLTCDSRSVTKTSHNFLKIFSKPLTVCIKTKITSVVAGNSTICIHQTAYKFPTLIYRCKFINIRNMFVNGFSIKNTVEITFFSKFFLLYILIIRRFLDSCLIKEPVIIMFHLNITYCAQFAGNFSDYIFFI